MAESFSRAKLRHAPQKEGGLEILCDPPPVRPRLVRPTNLMSRMNGKKTHTHTVLKRRYLQNAHFIPICSWCGKEKCIVWGTRFSMLDCHVLKGFGIYTIGILDRRY